jgi:Kef-type K+ transport system membrane component KefB
MNFNSFTPPANLSGAALTAYVLFDILLIILLARLLGGLFVKLKQPRVVGEILAGITLGPTLLGAELSLFITPAPVRPILAAVAAIGLILFMMLAGLQFELDRVKGRVKQAFILASASVAVPAALGFPLAWLLFTPEFAPAGAGSLPFGLMIGAALSVTAFPVMAHILLERGELNSPLGSLAVATAGLMSILMFSYIAIATALAASGEMSGLLLRFGAMALFIVVAWFGARPALARLLPRERTNLSGDQMAVVFGGLLLFAFIADRVGIHALVGGFLWGLIMPASFELRKTISARIADVALIFFLPVFFAVSGFATDLKTLWGGPLPAAALILLAAVGGKFLAAIPAKAMGLSWTDVGRLGALFNTRGLLILVVGLIGLQAGIFTELTFTILALVALLTNMMTLPLLDFFGRR